MNDPSWQGNAVPPDELAQLPEFDTRHPDFPLWLLEQGSRAVAGLLEQSGLLATEALCALVAQWVLGLALALKCVVERVAQRQGRLAVLSLAVNRLLLTSEELQRRTPAPLPLSARELDILEEFCHTGCWEMEQPPDEVLSVRQALHGQALAQLTVTDALLVGLLVAAEGRVEEAALLLDLESDLGKRTLAGVWRRLHQAELRLVEGLLQRGGRTVPPRWGLN
jgi:hypothetical protein